MKAPIIETEKFARTANRATKVWLIFFIGILLLCCMAVCLVLVALSGGLAAFLGGISNWISNL